MIDIKKRWIVIVITIAVLAILAMVAAAALVPGNSAQKITSIPAVNSPSDRDLFPDKAYPEFANGYSVEYHGTYKVVRTYDPTRGNSGSHTYVLVQRGENIPEGYPDAQVFFIPVESVITMSSVNVAVLGELNEMSAIRGNVNNNLVLNDTFQELAKAGKITEVGSGTMAMSNNFQTEKMVELSPDLVFCTEGGGQQQNIEPKLTETGLRPVLTQASTEDTPLGRAEWIKYYAYFFNKEKDANTVFDQVKTNYQAIADKVKNVSNRPTIISGLTVQGIWYVPGSRSYAARFFKDAGGDYVLSNYTGGGNTPIAFETVYEKGQNADVYLNPGMVGVGGGIDALLAQDSRFGKFKSVQTGAVYHFDARQNEFGSLDYWYSGNIRPDIILADLVKILHPDVLPDHHLYYYRQVGSGITGDTP
jgi:iron complex transport system substrate-binding protein